MSSLFQPLQLGALTLQNRIVMSPLMRARASSNRIPTDIMRRYYCQRASAGLIIAEATAISPQGIGYQDTPGIWCRAQAEGWQKITHSVHERGGKIFLQLRHVGRVSDPEFLHGEIPVAPSAIACPGSLNLPYLPSSYVLPRVLRKEEIQQVVRDFADAAARAREVGFDGIDIHAANGYLIDQFLHESSNQRHDDYGGSLENRSRFLMEIIDACTSVWSNDRIGVHLSPYGQVHGMSDTHSDELFKYLAQALDERKIAFLFIRQATGKQALTHAIRRYFSGKIILNQGFDQVRAEQAISSGLADAIAFGRAFISNPDLVERFAQNAALAPWDENTFFGSGAEGYLDYPRLNTCNV